MTTEILSVSYRNAAEILAIVESCLELVRIREGVNDPNRIGVLTSEGTYEPRIRLLMEETTGTDERSYFISIRS